MGRSGRTHLARGDHGTRPVDAIHRDAVFVRYLREDADPADFKVRAALAEARLALAAVAALAWRARGNRPITDRG